MRFTFQSSDQSGSSPSCPPRVLFVAHLLYDSSSNEEFANTSSKRSKSPFRFTLQNIRVFRTFSDTLPIPNNSGHDNTEALTLLLRMSTECFACTRPGWSSYKTKSTPILLPARTIHPMVR